MLQRTVLSRGEVVRDAGGTVPGAVSPAFNGMSTEAGNPGGPAPSHLSPPGTESGADVRTSTGFTCTTPCTMTVNRKNEFSVTFTKAGVEPEEVEVKTRIAGEGAAAGIVGDAIGGGVMGLAADAASGATLEHRPNALQIILYPNGE